MWKHVTLTLLKSDLKKTPDIAVLALGCKHLNVITVSTFRNFFLRVLMWRLMHKLVQKPVTKLVEGNIIVSRGARPSHFWGGDQKGDLEV